MAIESPLVTATATSAVEFPDLIRRYRVTGVPKTVVNDRNEVLGAFPEDSFVTQALSGLVPPAPEG
jgi:hypothetical protein